MNMMLHIIVPMSNFRASSFQSFLNDLEKHITFASGYAGNRESFLRSKLTRSRTSDANLGTKPQNKARSDD